MFKAIKKPNRKTELIKLCKKSAKYIDSDAISDTKPVAPVGVVNSTKVGIHTSFGNIRYLFLLPWLIGACIALYWQVEDAYITWKSQEESHLRFIRVRQEKYGEKYFDETNNKVAVEMYERIDENGRMPLDEYLDIRYRDSVGAAHRLVGDIIFGGANILAVIVLVISILSFHRRAPLYFDRVGRIVYTWRKGRVWAQYYDELWFYENHQAMTFILYSFDRKKCFEQKNFVVMPTGNPFMNGDIVYRPVLAFITQFMEKGRDAVFNRNWEGRRGWYLFDDKKPRDFDGQLEAVLQHIKTERVNEEADCLGAEWGWLGNAQSR